MTGRAADLIHTLGLLAHPEGGHFREVFRSSARVSTMDHRGERAALTTIYFLLAEGEVSRWHRVTSDEVWHFYEGAELELLTADSDFLEIKRVRLGELASGAQPVHVVPAHGWQAARSTAAYTLVGCSVGPGFDFQDFTLLRDHPQLAETLRQRHPDSLLFL